MNNSNSNSNYLSKIYFLCGFIIIIVFMFLIIKLAGYKIPRSIVFVEDLPYSPAGKLLRQKVRDLYGSAEVKSGSAG